jgi:hypothetical protein
MICLTIQKLSLIYNTPNSIMPIWNSFKYQDLVKILEHYGCYFSGE